jgi:hypothetical protein
MRRRLILAATLTITALLMLGGASGAQAAPGSLHILFDSNQGDASFTGFLPALRATPGVAVVDTFQSDVDTPSAALMGSHDLIVDTGDSSYGDPALYGDRLADYIDAGGAVIQFSYDNWESTNAHPHGRFESGGFAPLIPGDNVNNTTTLGQILVPGSPLLAGVPVFTTTDNVDDPLNGGATALALFADGRNAIATKGRVVSVAASPEDGGNLNPISAAAQLAVNAGNVLGRHSVTVKKIGGRGKVSSAPAGIRCGKTCTAVFAGTTTVTLKAKAKKKGFLRWKGVTGCKKKRTCTFTPIADMTVKAKFRKRRR